MSIRTRPMSPMRRGEAQCTKVYVGGVKKVCHPCDYIYEYVCIARFLIKIGSFCHNLSSFDSALFHRLVHIYSHYMLLQPPVWLDYSQNTKCDSNIKPPVTFALFECPYITFLLSTLKSPCQVSFQNRG